MLELEIQGKEFFDEDTMSFIEIKSQTLKLEHSLISISKWESKWCKPFLDSVKTVRETLDYIRCMTIGGCSDPNIYFCITNEQIKQINEYIKDPMSATTFNDRELKGRSNRNGELVTSEVIYYWMVSFRIPTEYEKWHLNRLMNLIKICEIKSRPPKKMKQNDILRQNAELNARRLKQYNTRG